MIIKQVTQKHFDILQKRQEGKTLTQIGIEMGISSTRVSQLETIAKTYVEAQKNNTLMPFDELSILVQNALKRQKQFKNNHKYTEDKPTLQEIATWFNSGELHKMDGIGKKSIQEIENFLNKYKQQLM